MSDETDDSRSQLMRAIMTQNSDRDEIARLRHQLSAARRAVEAAICAECSDQIADEDWLVDGNGKLVHTRCAARYD